MVGRQGSLAPPEIGNDNDDDDDDDEINDLVDYCTIRYPRYVTLRYVMLCYVSDWIIYFRFKSNQIKSNQINPFAEMRCAISESIIIICYLFCLPEPTYKYRIVSALLSTFFENYLSYVNKLRSQSRPAKIRRPAPARTSPLGSTLQHFCESTSQSVESQNSSASETEASSG